MQAVIVQYSICSQWRRKFDYISRTSGSSLVIKNGQNAPEHSAPDKMSLR